MPLSTTTTALSDLPIGSCATLRALQLPEAIQEHLINLGFIPETRVLAVRRAPAGDPTVYCVEGAQIALRRETAQFIVVEDIRIANRELQSRELQR